LATGNLTRSGTATVVGLPATVNLGTLREVAGAAKNLIIQTQPSSTATAGVAFAQQPAPTDCTSAVRNRPANGKVLFGDDSQKNRKGKPDKGKGKSSSTDEIIDLITRRISR